MAESNNNKIDSVFRVYQFVTIFVCVVVKTGATCDESIINLIKFWAYCAFSQNLVLCN